MSLSTFPTAISTSCWNRAVGTYSHKLFTGSSKTPRPTSLFGFSSVPRGGQAVADVVYPSLSETIPYTADPTDPTSKTTISVPDRCSCLHVTSSEYPVHAWLVTPNCPVALLAGDPKAAAIRVPIALTAPLNIGILNDFVLPEAEALELALAELASAAPHTVNQRQNAVNQAKYALDLAKRSIYSHPSNPDILETSRNFVSMAIVERQLHLANTRHMAGNEYELGPWLIRSGTVFSRSAIASPHLIVVELELLPVLDINTPHQVFVDAFMDLIPQASHMVQINAISGESIWNVRSEREMLAKETFAASNMKAKDFVEELDPNSANPSTSLSDVPIDGLVKVGAPLKAIVVSTYRFPGFEQYMLPRIMEPRHVALLTAYAMQISPNEK